VSTLVPASTGHTSVDDFPPLTPDQVARIATLLSTVQPKTEEAAA
jgi:hypothetical protein